MTLSLRSRLTLWYTALLVGALTIFCAVILWLDWRSLLRVSLLGLPLMIALAGGGGWWLAHRALRPLSRMAAEAESIDATVAERRLTTPPDAPELERVAMTFNSVLDRLAKALADQR